MLPRQTKRTDVRGLAVLAVLLVSIDRVVVCETRVRWARKLSMCYTLGKEARYLNRAMRKGSSP
jgi:hypothetical protein